MEQKLTLLKKKEKMIPKDILPLEHEIEETIQDLINVRGGYLFKENHVNNRTDEELNKVCQLISLCFMTIGKWHESKFLYVVIQGFLYANRPRHILSSDCYQGKIYPELYCYSHDIIELFLSAGTNWSI
jgi:hypothetical protein